MKVRTREWGTLEVSEEQLVHIPDGLLGFEELHHFVLVDIEECRPFLWMMSIDDPDVAFVLAEPAHFHEGDYTVNLTRLDEQRMGLAEGDTLAVFVIVGVDGRGAVTANLRGPLALNTRTRTARQIITYGAGLALRQPIRGIRDARVCTPAEPMTTRV